RRAMLDRQERRHRQGRRQVGSGQLQRRDHHLEQAAEQDRRERLCPAERSGLTADDLFQCRAHGSTERRRARRPHGALHCGHQVALQRGDRRHWTRTVLRRTGRNRRDRPRAGLHGGIRRRCNELGDQRKRIADLPRPELPVEELGFVQRGASQLSAKRRASLTRNNNAPGEAHMAGKLIAAAAAALTWTSSIAGAAAVPAGGAVIADGLIDPPGTSLVRSQGNGDWRWCSSDVVKGVAFSWCMDGPAGSDGSKVLYYIHAHNENQYSLINSQVYARMKEYWRVHGVVAP